MQEIVFYQIVFAMISNKQGGHYVRGKILAGRKFDENKIWVSTCIKL